MNRIEPIKAAVSPADAAERYGLKVSRNGMARCPFHDDHHPSLRLYDDHFYCFACAAHGDVIDLTAKLLGVSVPASFILSRYTMLPALSICIIVNSLEFIKCIIGFL